MKILGIETSCDETAAAVVVDGTQLLSNVVVSQIDIHKEFGGVVPEVAARSHIEVILPTVDKAIKDAGLNWDEIDAIAVTKGPGLIGSLLIGVLTARTLALVKNKPLYGIHHVLGHVYANFLTEIRGSSQEPGARSQYKLQTPNSKLLRSVPRFPTLALIVSGGHSQLVLFKDHFDYRLLGETRDDAVGEAYDKVATILGLPYPGGPSIDKISKLGDADKYPLPDAKLDQPYDFSFSGLKTAVLRTAQRIIAEDFSFPSHKIAARLNKKQQRDLGASFQKAAVNTLVTKTLKAYREFEPKSVVIAGGVAANLALRAELKKALPIDIQYAPINLCTDNAAMIASLAYFQANLRKSDDPLTLQAQPSLSI